MDFHEHSKKIVKDYISTVAYVDDLIFSTKGTSLEPSPIPELTRESVAQNRQLEEAKIQTENRIISPNINPLNFTAAFFNQGFHCSLLELNKNKDNFSSIEAVLKKTDVIILDWQMYQDMGKTATELLLSVLNESKDNPELRLFIIYTQEKNYKEIIFSKIYPELMKIDPTIIEPAQDACTINIQHSKITVLYKKDTDDAYAVSEDKLPERIIDELTDITEGLVSNTVLKSIYLLRKHTNILLGLFNKELDVAYLTHRAFCPNPEDAETLLIHTISDSFDSILSYANISDVCNSEKINALIDTNILEDKTIKIKFGNIKKDVTIGKEHYKKWLKDGYDKSFRELEDNGIHMNDKDMIDLENNQLKTIIPNCFQDNNKSNESFAMLTHHKSCIKNPNYVPYLTLGVVIKDLKENYYLCIQQRCDSVRLESDERYFLFLPLDTKGGSHSILFNDNSTLKHLKIKDKHCHNIFFEKFKATNKGVVEAKRDSNSFRFDSVHNRKFWWVFELKDSHAQRIANNYAAALSRVGLDESEWLRRL
jgi:hypothetical protein